LDPWAQADVKGCIIFCFMINFRKGCCEKAQLSFKALCKYNLKNRECSGCLWVPRHQSMTMEDKLKSNHMFLAKDMPPKRSKCDSLFTDTWFISVVTDLDSWAQADVKACVILCYTIDFSKGCCEKAQLSFSALCKYNLKDRECNECLWVPRQQSISKKRNWNPNMRYTQNMC